MTHGHAVDRDSVTLCHDPVLPRTDFDAVPGRIIGENNVPRIIETKLATGGSDSGADRIQRLAIDEHLLWHVEIDDWPDDDRVREIAFSVGDRIEDAWGARQRRYLARTGNLAGRLDLQKLRE